MNIEKIREDFPALKREVNGKKLVYFDNAATSLKPRQVLDAERCYYEKNCANIHRGLHEMSENASEVYETAHEKTANFVNAKNNEVIFTKNATEAMNLLMYSMRNGKMLKKGDKVVVSLLEHHSNIIPWQYLKEKIGINLEIVGLDKDYDINLEELKEKSKGAKLVSVSGASNTVSTHTNLKEIEKIVHDNNALFCVDAAQLVPHEKIDFKKMNADFMVFSGHKMLAPTGTGCLVGKEELLEKMEPFLFGGDMISNVSEKGFELNNLPAKFEAGTPNIAGAYGLNEAINYLEKIGMENVKEHEMKLTKQAIKGLENLNLNVYGPKDDRQGGIILFDCGKINCHDIAMLLNDEGIAIRSGMHCAQPMVESINKDGLARASFYLYNTKEEVNYFLEKLEEIVKEI
jgi:cysteine desulfurase / selenocysteine lyase